MMYSLCQFCLNLSILVLMLVCLIKADGGHFSYDDQETWSYEYPQCSGKLQSPINLKSSTAIVDKNLDLKFEKYDEPFNGHYYWTNDGHTLKLVKLDYLPVSHILTGNAVEHGHYTFKQLHFHWGKRKDTGSEHQVDGVSYPLELHLVHQTIESGKQFAKSNKYTVLAVFFTIGRENPILNDIVNSVHELSIENKHLAVKPRNYGVLQLLPYNLNSYFVYNGSLTTPHCNETVRWIVFKGIQELSEDQLLAIRNTIKIDGNSRRIQNYNSRLVFQSDNEPMSREKPNFNSSIIAFNLVSFSIIIVVTVVFRNIYSYM